MDHLLAKLYHSLDIAVFSKGSAGFKLQTRAPAWLVNLFPKQDFESVCDLGALFPFLECYLPIFEYHWDNQNTELLLSDVWVETTAMADEIPLEAKAVCMEGTAFLLLQHLGEKYEAEVKMLQKARDNLLIKESLEAKLINSGLK